MSSLGSHHLANQECPYINPFIFSDQICNLFCPFNSLPPSVFISFRPSVYLFTHFSFAHHPLNLTGHLSSLPLSTLLPSISLSRLSPILTGKPGGKRRVMKSRSLANRALEIAMRSMIGTTCSARDRGWDSHNHNLALNLETSTHTRVCQWILPNTILT